MNFIQDDVEEMGKLAGYVQFMVYTDVNRSHAEPLGEAIWMDMKALFSEHYYYGTKHSIAMPALSEPVEYTVAMIPFVGYVDYDGFPGKVLRQLVYLVRSEVFPLLAEINPNEIGQWLYPDLPQ
ncbi:hypothetical protein [Spirosoma foliorum]|uniref:Uncharacterized protein n=1 Tax=Spirosoma foliorum TaxID=2710596 RepID=A0A7G5H5K9_9BACT|nr:hypothetical protein [Spirosoma foliorum]QMW06401.1 hypothetical protein H3H32_16660 [Spirosoma foliorum]